jgi:GNAT superfamily N-acetyltransferase
MTFTGSMPTTNPIQILPIDASDAALIQSAAKIHWGDVLIVVHGSLYYLDHLPGFKAVQNGTMQGMVTYQIGEGLCEIVSLDSFIPQQGIGRKLVDAVIETARQAGCKKILLVSTNDNLDAMAFYQKLGFQMVWVEPDAVTRSREIKPSIPLLAENGLPIRDEITFELKI